MVCSGPPGADHLPWQPGRIMKRPDRRPQRRQPCAGPGHAHSALWPPLGVHRHPPAPHGRHPLRDADARDLPLWVPTDLGGAVEAWGLFGFVELPTRRRQLPEGDPGSGQASLTSQPPRASSGHPRAPECGWARGCWRCSIGSALTPGFTTLPCCGRRRCQPSFSLSGQIVVAHGLARNVLGV